MTTPDGVQPKPGATSDAPIPVRVASRLVRQWIGQLGTVWVEGQITQIKERSSSFFITLRDPDADLSIPVMATANTARAAGLAEGHRVVAQLRLNYYDRNGSLQWRANQFRPVGVGALMQQLDQLRRTLTQEGLFRDVHKQPLPALPRRIGLICGVNSAAQHDVQVNALRHWPAAVFEVRQVTVQGARAVADVIGALVELDQLHDVDVIVITRGGGAFEDLLPFSNEAMVRAVFGARTPVVSAIGHEEDNPLLDLVADVRASTPTAAGKTIVPDLLNELEVVAEAISRIRTLTADRLTRERDRVTNLSGRPVMGGPGQIVAEQRRLVGEGRQRARRVVSERVQRERVQLRSVQARPPLQRPLVLVAPHRTHLRNIRTELRRNLSQALRAARADLQRDSARLTALSPQGTLERGYAVVRTHGQIVRTPADVHTDELLHIRVAGGSFGAITVAADPGDRPT